MNLLDRAISWFSPAAALQRAHARAVLARYDAATPSRTRPHRKMDGGSAEVVVQRDAATIRSLARTLERDHDLVRGAMGVAVRNIVGPNGISVEPQPRRGNDDIDDDFARQLLNLWRDWTRHPEVTRTLDWVEAQHLACRAWLRDGEVFGQHVEGPVATLDHGTQVPYSIELLEPDFVPLDHHDDSRGVFAGIERNDWGRPIAFYVHRRHPGGFLRQLTADLKRVPAERMLHVAVRDRFSGLRGISILASVITRLEDLKDYEESERVAARMGAAIAAFIKRSPDMQWTPPADFDPLKPRNIRMRAGMLIDDLLPGEELDMLDPSRPNPNLGTFRDDQLRAVSAGTDIGYSSLSRSYNGTYSAQRQELVEQWSAYQVATQHFTARFVRPVWERFVSVAIASGQIRVPAGIRPETVAQADFKGPPMPWIDPLKEGTALRLLTRTGIRSLQQIIGERGGRLQDVFEQLRRERDLAAELGLVLESDAATGVSDGDRTDDPEPNPPAAPTAAKRSTRKRVVRKKEAHRARK